MEMSTRYMKEMEWKATHPLAGYKERKGTFARCYKCGKVRRIIDLREVGNEVYLCKDGCRD